MVSEETCRQRVFYTFYFDVWWATDDNGIDLWHRSEFLIMEAINMFEPHSGLNRFDLHRILNIWLLDYEIKTLTL